MAAVVCDVAAMGGGGGGGGGRVWLLSPQLPGGANDESKSISEEGVLKKSTI